MTEIRNTKQLDCRFTMDGVARASCPCSPPLARCQRDTRPGRPRHIENRSGFTLVELLLAVAIAGMLLGAVAFAFNASAINCRENEEIFKTMNNARQAMFRMTSQLRTSDAVNPNAPSNECTMITAAGQDITYRYNSGDNKLYLVTNYDLFDSDYVLCDNVTAMTCTKNWVVEDSEVKVKSVQISITVSSGDMQRTVSTAAAIRRNLN